MQRALYAAMATNMDSSVFFRFIGSARPHTAQASTRPVSLIASVDRLAAGDTRRPTQPKRSAQGRVAVRLDAWMSR
jgi:hypothetical protein